MPNTKIDSINIGGVVYDFNLPQDAEVTVKKLNVTNPKLTVSVSGTALIIKENY